MKAEFTSEVFLLITAQDHAESIALGYMFIKEKDPTEWTKKIVIDSNLPDSNKPTNN
jgi:hypothetical protein